jgi:PAS domain S-box-containing protein
MKMNFYQSLIEGSPDLISVIDTEGICVYVNSSYEKVLGYKREELLGKHFSKVISLERNSLEYTLSIFSSVLSGEKTDEFQVTIYHKAGYPLTFNVKYTLLKEEGFLQIVLRDITEEQKLKKQKSELAKMNKLLADVLDHTGIGIFITDPNQEDNPIIYHNKGFESLTGYESDEIIGKNCRFLQGPLTSNDTKRVVREKMENQEEVKVEILNYRKDQTTFWNEVCINPVLDKHGSVSHYIGIQMDVTKKKLLELDLKREFSLSRTIQQLILSKDIADQSITICGSYFPSHELGGDFYKWQKMDEDLYFVMIMDVMGHGIASSLLTMSINAALTSMLKYDSCHPTYILNRLNQHMLDLFSDGKNERMTRMYFTCIVLLIDTKNQSIDYINSGHPSFILEEGEKLKEIPSNEIPVGFLPNHQFQEETLYYNDNTELFLYTDGLLEYLNNSLAELTKKKEKDKNLFLHLTKELKTKQLQDDICFIQVKLL